jgi:hypothetical protein
MSAQPPSSNRLWVEQEFGGIPLGDQRRQARLLEAATAIADQPDASNPQRFDWNELRGFYRLVHGPLAKLDVLQSRHREATRQRVLATPHRVLHIHDTTQLDFTNHPAIAAQLGPIGKGEGRGLLQHNTLAFDPQAKQILGLLHQQLERRLEQPPNESRQARYRRAQKESRLWLLGIAAVGQCPAGRRWIDVCDRGGDFFEAMHQARQLGHEFLIRIHQDRCLTIPEANSEPEAE